MHSLSSWVALAAAVTSVNAAYQGFNYGNVFTDGRPKSQSDFEGQFEAAANLAGTNGNFASARLYTMVQAGTANDPIAAIPAAINTGTSLLLGLWASAGSEAFANEIQALRRTIDEYGDQLDGLIAGISVGSEDLYRISPTGIANNENPGTGPDTLVGYFEQVRDAIEGTSFADYPVGHVDTWTAWDNSSNQAVIDASDFIGFNGFAYFEDTQPNDVSNGKSLFDRAVGRTQAAVGGKPIWITETGWPVSGRTTGEGVPSPENAETFWKEVGCPLFGETNTWWYTFQDSSPDTPNPSFGVIGSELSTEPLYDLSCDGVGSPSSTPSSTPSATESNDTPPPSSTDREPTATESQDPPEPTDDQCDDDDGHLDDEDIHDCGDDGDDDDVPSETVSSAPPPATSSAEESTPPTSEPGGNASASPTESAPAPSGTDGADDPPIVEPDSASAMSFSAAFLAVMLAVAIF